MEYAAMTFWLVVIVFSALGVHRLWSSLIQPKMVNTLLLPGTLVAQLGHIVGLLITGGTVNNTALVKDDDSGEPQTGTDPKTRIPVLGVIVVALLPMIGCALAIYGVSQWLGSDILARMPRLSSEQFWFSLPTSLPLLFSMLRGAVTQVENLVQVIQGSDLADWQTLLFLYLVVCLTVRMAPLTGNIRGALGAILLTGILAFLIGQIGRSSIDSVLPVWPLITFSVAVLILLLMVSLLVKAAVSLVKTCTA